MQLALAEKRLRRGLQLVVVEADEGAAHQRQPVEHLAAEDDGARLARERRILAQVEGVVVAPDGEVHAVPARDARQDGEVEVDDVPAGDDVGIELSR